MTKSQRTNKQKNLKVLAKQKPKRHWAIYLRNKITLISLTVIVGGLGLYYGVTSLYHAATDYFVDGRQPIAFHISITSKNGQVGAEQRIVIEEIISDLVVHGRADELDEAAQEIQYELQAQQVTLSRFDYDRIRINIALRQPILHVKADRLRNVTAIGQIYGSASQDEKLPQILGIFAGEEKKWDFDDDQTLKVTEHQRQMMQEAVELYQLAKKEGYGVSSIQYIKFRGFLLRTKDDNIEIAFGRSPFNSRMRELNKILKDLKQKGRQASRIELDYKGKAFIKEKSL